jgi:long-chain fatty acid transport protein
MRLKALWIVGLGMLPGLVSGMAWAAGLILYEIDSPSTGTASAGWAALAQDASTLFTNPAGMTRLDRSQLLVGAQPVIITSEFNSGPGTQVSGGGGDGGNAGGVLPSLAGYYVHSVTDRFKLGIGGLSYFGLGIDYGDSWVGRYRVQKANLIAATLTSSAAYRLNEYLSVGAMFNVLAVNLNDETAINNVADKLPDGQLKYEDDDLGYGAGAGMMVELSPRTRFGATYYSPVKLTFRDTPSFSNLGPGLNLALTKLGVIGNSLKMDFTVPQWVMMSGYQQVTEQLALMANVGWQDWSEFGKVDMALQVDPLLPNGLNANLHMKDTWHGAIGMQYRITQPWLLSLGFAYDSSPMTEANRSPALPLDRNLRYAAGIQYDWSQNLTLGLAYEFIDTGSANLDKSGGPLIGSLQGDYDPNNVNVVNLNLVYKF